MAEKHLTLIDSDGNRYIFNNARFKSIMNSQKKKTGKTIGMIQEELADAINVSPETVKKWSSPNAPNDIQIIKKIASLWEISYFELLIPLDNGICILGSEDKKLIKMVYQSLFSVIMENAELISSPMENSIEEDNKKESRKQIISYRTQSLKKIRAIHRNINMEALTTQEKTRKCLHQIVCQAEIVISGEAYSIPDEWSESYYRDALRESYYACDRETLFMDDASKYCYLIDEIDLADDYGLPYKADDDAFFEASLEDQLTYGCDGNSLVTPLTVYENQLTKCLSEVFNKNFSDILKGEKQ